MADAHLTLGQPLGPRGAHVVLVHRVEHVGAQHSAVEPDEEHGQREPRQDQVIRPLQRVLGQRHIAAGREQLDLEAEEVQQNRRQPEDRHRNPHQRKDCQRAVGELARVYGTHVAEHDRQRHPDHRRADAQRERRGHAVPDLLDDVAVLRVGRQLAGEDLLHHRQVLHHQGFVESEIRADAGDQRRIGVLARDPCRRVRVRDDVEDQEHDHRDREQHRDHAEKAPGDESGHQCSSRIFARGSSASRRPSPNTFSDNTVAMIIRPGTIVRCGAV